MLLRYHYFTRDPVVIPRLHSIGYASDTRVTRYGPTRRHQYLIHYVISGRGSFNGVSLGAGEGFITTPGLLEHYFPDESDPWTYLWIISYDTAMDELIGMHGADADTGIFKFQNVHVVGEIAKRLIECDGGFTFSNTEITEMYLSIFNNCVYPRSKARTTNAEAYLDHSVKYISSNLFIPISVGELCGKLGVSQPYLYRIFKEKLGCSPKQYICECRLSEAKRLLEETSFTVSDIAAAVGYPDVLAFSKFFSGKVGLSPTAYRRSSAITKRKEASEARGEKQL